MPALSTIGGLAGTALGGPVGGFIGAGAGSLLGSLFGKKKRPEENDARSRLSALTNQLLGQANEVGSPYESAGYQAQVGTLRDTLRDQSDADAGRAGALGLAPGFAVAAGAGGRSRAMAEGVRGAAAGAEHTAAARRARLQALSASLLGTEAGLDQADADRRRQSQGAWLNTLGNLGGAAAGAAINKWG